MLGTQEAPRFSDHVDLDNLQRCGNVMAGKDGADGPEGLKLKIEGDSERFCQADLLLSGAWQPHSRRRASARRVQLEAACTCAYGVVC